MEYLYYFATFLAIITTAESLQCWTCQSMEGGQCADFFNETTIRRTPQTYNSIDNQFPTPRSCDSILGFHITNQKAVCLKKVQTINGRKHYTRKCELAHIDLPVGECPSEQQGDSRVYTDFCEQCDREFCNAANVPKMINFLILFPLVSILLLRK